MTELLREARRLLARMSVIAEAGIVNYAGWQSSQGRRMIFNVGDCAKTWYCSKNTAGPRRRVDTQ